MVLPINLVNLHLFLEAFKDIQQELIALYGV
jgi:hypothetical protein